MEIDGESSILGIDSRGEESYYYDEQSVAKCMELDGGWIRATTSFGEVVLKIASGTRSMLILGSCPNENDNKKATLNVIGTFTNTLDKKDQSKYMGENEIV